MEGNFYFQPLNLRLHQRSMRSGEKCCFRRLNKKKYELADLKNGIEKLKKSIKT
jgi:hypothetical protein